MQKSFITLTPAQSPFLHSAPTFSFANFFVKKTFKSRTHASYEGDSLNLDPDPVCQGGFEASVTIQCANDWANAAARVDGTF